MIHLTVRASKELSSLRNVSAWIFIEFFFALITIGLLAHSIYYFLFSSGLLIRSLNEFFPVGLDQSSLLARFVTLL